MKVNQLARTDTDMQYTPEEKGGSQKDEKGQKRVSLMPGARPEPRTRRIGEQGGKKEKKKRQKRRQMERKRDRERQRERERKRDREKERERGEEKGKERCRKRGWEIEGEKEREMECVCFRILI